MSQLFSTDLLPASDRIDAWQWNAQQICGDCRVRLPKSSFHGSIEIRNVAGLPLTRFSSSALSFWKWPFDTVSAHNRFCLVITQIAGIRQYSQSGEEVLLRPGDSTLIDTALPWSSSCDTDCVRLYLRVPRWIMEHRIQMREIPIVQRIAGSTPLGGLLTGLSQTLYDEACSMESDELAAAVDHYFEVLAGCVRGRGNFPTDTPDLRVRILRFIDAHIADPALGPAQIADGVDISIRHLHRVFSSSGKSLGDYIRALRLEQCRKDLFDPRLRERSITEIAFARGFCDAAHFSHSFRKQFGVSARALRAAGKAKGMSPQGFDTHLMRIDSVGTSDSNLN